MAEPSVVYELLSDSTGTIAVFTDPDADITPALDSYFEPGCYRINGERVYDWTAVNWTLSITDMTDGETMQLTMQPVPLYE